MKNSEVYNLSWSDFDKLISEITFQVKEKKISIDTIIGIERSGLIPAVCLSHLLEIRDFYPLAIRRTASDKPYAAKFPAVIGETSHLTVADRNVLIVDDVIHTGETFRAACEILKQKGAREVTLVAVVDRKVKRNSDTNVDIRGMFADTWVNFPWNINL